MGAGASIDMNSLPDRMTLEEVEDKIGSKQGWQSSRAFQCRCIHRRQNNFKEHFLVGIKNGMGGEPGLDRPPEELQVIQEEQAQKAVEDAAREKAKMEKEQAERVAAAAAAKNKQTSKYDMSQFKVAAYDPEVIKKRREEQLKREKKRLEILKMDPNKAENEKQRDRILRVQAREQEMLSDLHARKGLTHLKDTRSRMSTEDKMAAHTDTKIKAVSYDEDIAKNAKDNKIVETCSCLQGSHALSKIIVWTDKFRFAVAKAYGMGFGKSKTGIHFSDGVDLQDQSTETLTVNGKVLGR